jgi:hypothetical protein
MRKLHFGSREELAEIRWRSPEIAKLDRLCFEVAASVTSSTPTPTWCHDIQLLHQSASSGRFTDHKGVLVRQESVLSNRRLQSHR